MKTFYFLLLAGATFCAAYDFTLDLQKDTRGWKFKGQYIYANTITDGGRFAPDFERPAGSPPIVTQGVWYFGHTEPDPLSDDIVNYGEMKFRLKHHLMAEVIVRLVAHPSVVVEMQANEGKVLQRFRSTGKGWCDASYAVWKRLGAEIRVAANLTEPRTYLLVDKVTIGVMSPVKSIDRSTLNPCEVVERLPTTTTTQAPVNLSGSATMLPPASETIDDMNAVVKMSTSTTEATVIQVE